MAILAAVFTFGFVSQANAELDTDPDPTWQVVTHIPDSVGLQTLVWDFAELDGVMYVGGSFAEVRQGSGQARSDQAHLAAFDVDTGEWIPGFAPDLDGAVFTIEASPDGSHLMIGGEFTGALKAINPITGQTLPGWGTTATHTATRAAVMDIEPDGSGGWYIGGNLTHIDDGQGPQRRYRLARVDSSGALDSTWKPLAQGGRVYTIAKSKVADWVHVGGKFTSMNAAEETGFLATISATNGALIDGVAHGYPAGAISSVGVIAQKIYGIEATTDKLWVGGEPHTLIAMDPTTLKTERFWFTNRGLGDPLAGGDIQAVHVTNDRVYAGCHCWGSVGGFDALAPNEWTDYLAWVTWFATQKGDPVNGVFAVDKADMEHSRTFLPDLTGQEGVWAIIEDSNGRMWFGGEFTSAAGAYPGGFIRYSDSGIATPQTVVGTRSQWTYHNSATTPPEDWKTVGFDDTNWMSGRAELGFGDGNETTVIDSLNWSRSAYFRHEFEAINTPAAEHLAINVTADDGYIAYLNGTEIGRARMPAGTPTASTLANRAVWGIAEQRADRVLIPTSLLQDGTNIFAVQVHNTSAGGDLSFDAELKAASSTNLTPPKPLGPKRPAPNLLVSDYTNGTRVVLRFNELNTNEVSNYVVYRDGQVLQTTSSSTFVDTSTAIGETHTYTVATVDLDGQTAVQSDPVVVTTGSPAYTSRRWARTIPTDWSYTVTDPGQNWNTPGFDDAAWSQGTDRIGFGQRGLDTDVEPTNAMWLRSTITIADAHATPDTLLLFVEADDAGIVYLNGKEVWRNNYADGQITATSGPQNPMWTNIDERTRYSMIPGDLLKAGENTFAMQVNNEPGSNDLFASLGAMMINYEAGQNPATPTSPTATAVGTTGVALTWAPTDSDIAVGSYSIHRNGEMIGVSATNAFFDPAPAGTWDYTIKAISTTGDRSAPTTATIVTVTRDGDPPPPPPPPGEWACTVTANANTVEINWPDIGANGYDVIPNGGSKRWTRINTYTHVAPADSYTIIAWGNEQTGKTVTCDNPNPNIDGGWQCTITLNAGTATINWPDLQANGYDIVSDTDPKKWTRATTHTDPTPATQYTITAWGNGVSGTTTQCTTP